MNDIHTAWKAMVIGTVAVEQDNKTKLVNKVSMRFVSKFLMKKCNAHTFLKYYVDILKQCRLDGLNGHTKKPAIYCRELLP